ncbi:MAG: B12-binding domain-containing radical SAM protein [Magnetococcales bacterium]|nr:B12-binding domain-containing radical SAM protein [Magnetococcales bacterium]
MNLPISTPPLEAKFDNSSLYALCDSLKKQFSISPKLLLVQTPQIDFKTFDPKIAKKKGYYNYPPTGLQYLYESIKSLDIEVRILNLNMEILRRCHESSQFDHLQWMDILSAELKSFQPSIVGVSCMFDMGIDPMLEIFQLLKKENQSIVIAGGLIPTHEWQNLLKRKLCHFVVEGEGENKLPFLLSSLFSWKTDREVPGIHFNFGDKTAESQGPKDIVEFDFDLIASYAQIPVEENYKYGSLNPFGRMAGIDDSPYCAIQLHRGCRAACTFCSVHGLMGKGVRRRKVATVIAEMAFLIKKKGIKHFEWLDDDLLFYKKEFQELLQTIIDKKWDITWSANNGLIVAAIDEKTMSLIKESGCIGIKLGFESGNQEMLRNVHKPGGTLEKYYKTCKILNRYPEVFTGANIIVGFPDEYFFQMMDSFRFYLQSGTDWGAFNTCQTVRGASAFSDFGSYFDAQMEGGGTNVKNFNPARREVSGEVDHEVTVLSGYNIFNIDPNSQPGEDQIQEIWFTFNLVGNFIFNKNLLNNGRIQNFIGWVEMAQIPYQTNPYMALFLGLAHQIAGRPKVALEYLTKTQEVLAKSSYWQERFTDFDLNWVVKDFPQDQTATFLVMSELRRRAESHFPTA